MEKIKRGDISPGLIIFIEQMKVSGYEFLTNIIVDTKEKKVYLFSEELFCSIDCEIGKNGFVLYEDSKIGDCKTPICKTKVRHIDMPIYVNNPDSSVLTKTIEPKINLGPCFVCLYITEPGKNEIRGIGFHGSSDDSKGLAPTDGCIRLYNSDIYLIRKLFYKNLNVEIV
jgi:L,D-peptidoglycan transpeptidase YkuD (ErfK/YbiS/YcfS/YnhG family)